MAILHLHLYLAFLFLSCHRYPLAADMTIELQPEIPETIVVGVLALQGAFHEHIAYLNRQAQATGVADKQTAAKGSHDQGDCRAHEG